MIFSMLCVIILLLWFCISVLFVMIFVVCLVCVGSGRLLVSSRCRFFFFVNVVFVVLFVLGVMMILVKIFVIVFVVGLLSG